MTPNKLDINLFQSSAKVRLDTPRMRKPIPFAAVMLILAAAVVLVCIGGSHVLKRANFKLSSELAESELMVAESSNDDVYAEVRKLNAYNQASSLYIGYLAGRDRLNSEYFSAVTNCAGGDVIINSFYYDGAALDVDCSVPYPGNPVDFVQKLNATGVFSNVVYRGCTEVDGGDDSPDTLWFVLTCELK